MTSRRASTAWCPSRTPRAGEDHRPNNLDYCSRTLAGFMVNPNVGAVLLVDDGGRRRDRLRTSPPSCASTTTRSIAVPHASFTRRGGFEDDLAAAAALVEPWLPEVGRPARAPSSRWPTCGSAAVRRLRRLLRHHRATRCPGRCRPRWCGTAAPRCSRRDRRADRRRGLCAGERPRPSRPPATSCARSRLQGAASLARRHRRGQPVRRQHLPRPLQHRAEVDRRRPQARPGGCGSTTCIDYGEAACARTASTSWTAPATTWRASPARSPPAAT